jgi:hypothetical protein
MVSNSPVGFAAAGLAIGESEKSNIAVQNRVARIGRTSSSSSGRMIGLSH